ncbi:MAG TPA: IS256 family transposase [Gemmatimonadaceae bacterium]|nr:IS256 family transposase [Gemmatimonadaceae bacterium]
MTVRSHATPNRGRKQGVAPEVPEDALRTMLQSLIQETLEREFHQFVGAAPHERTAARRGWRNGRRDRTLLTRVGPLTLRVPRDRAGEFQPTLFARYQRSEQALVLALAEMYLQGVSTRKVSAVVEQLGGTTISASTVSACTQRLDARLAAWRARRLDGPPYPYLILDAHHERIRREGQVLATAALWVIGIRADGYRDHLGLWLGASESAASWAAVFRDLVQRGLTGVTYAVSDEHEGLVAALAPRAPKAAEWLETTLGETLAVYVLSEPEARRRLRTTNAVEHDHAEVRRRTRVIRIFPNEDSFLRLATALAAERSDHWAARRYLILQQPPRATVKRLKKTA